MKCSPAIKNRTNQWRQTGFTLVELLLVLSILALLAGLVLPKLVGTKEKANVKVATTQLGAFATALDLFEVENGHYPKNLNDLVQKPRDASTEWHEYLDRIPLDPWQQPYIYVFPGRHRPTSYDLSSAGPDMRPGTEDDIPNWTK